MRQRVEHAVLSFQYGRDRRGQTAARPRGKAPLFFCPQYTDSPAVLTSAIYHARAATGGILLRLPPALVILVPWMVQ